MTTCNKEDCIIISDLRYSMGVLLKTIAEAKSVDDLQEALQLLNSEIARRSSCNGNGTKVSKPAKEKTVTEKKAKKPIVVEAIIEDELDDVDL